MRNFVTVVFPSAKAAYEGQHALWELDGEGKVTVHGTGVVHRDSFGQLIVDTDDSMPPGLATAVGAGIGALLGAIAGPVGSAIGIAGASAISAGAGAAAGAGIVGSGSLIGEAAHEDIREQVGYESTFVLGKGQYAVIADVSEDWTAPINTRMNQRGGTVYRRPRKSIREDAWNYPYNWDSYLYPYEYRPDMYEAA